MTHKKAPKLAILSAEKMYQIILRPIISEKTTLMSEHNQHAFEVALDSSKPEIKAAVEGIFKVKVKAVNTVRLKGKTKRFRGVMGKRSDRKKAYITLEAGSTLDVMAGI